MKTSRLEAFSDGVMAIIITIMVLELKIPEAPDFYSLLEVLPVFVSYLVSFIFIGTYWNGHHHLFQVSEKVNGKVLWANLHLLFWLSLVPFATSWLGEHYRAYAPAVFYGFILFMSGISYNILVNLLLRHHGNDSLLKQALGSRRKGNISLALYLVGMGLSFFSPLAGIICYVVVLGLWFVPDRRIENLFE